MTTALAPLEPPYSPEVAGLLEAYPQRDGYLLSLFRTFAHSPRFLRKGVPNLLDRESPLPLREREIVILRVTAHLQCEYEWGIHVAAFAKAARLSDDQVRATLAGAATDASWSEREALMIAAVDQLCRLGRIAPETYAEVAVAFTRDEQLEIIALCGAYHTVSYVANTAGLAPEPFAARFPDSRPPRGRHGPGRSSRQP